MGEIVAVGKEEFTLGFEIVGIKAYPFEEFEEVIGKNSSAGIVIISQEEYDQLSLKLKTQIDKLLRPIVIILSEDDIKGGNLRNAIIRALGVDLLKDK